MRIGHGYDVHKLVEGRRLILGGVDIPFEKGLLGHSDADVLTHAVMDALLGAAALGDIGRHFPDNDPAYAGADSLALLRAVMGLLEDRGYSVGNVDATVLAQAPKLAPHIPKMRENLAQAMGVDVSQVSVKATTEEGLGFTGAKEGIAAHAVALLMPLAEELCKLIEQKEGRCRTAAPFFLPLVQLVGHALPEHGLGGPNRLAARRGPHGLQCSGSAEPPLRNSPLCSEFAAHWRRPALRRVPVAESLT